MSIILQYEFPSPTFCTYNAYIWVLSMSSLLILHDGMNSYQGGQNTHKDKMIIN